MPLPLASPIAARGQALFLDNTRGRCNVCHFNAGANGDPAIFGAGGNLNFNTGVEDLPDAPGQLLGDPTPPRDDGFGSPGDGTFNTPPLVEAADTGPFFHNNSVATLEAAVGFYDGDAFNESPAGQLILQATGSPLEIDATEIQAIAAFLRVINALENIRQAEAYLTEAGAASRHRRRGYHCGLPRKKPRTPSMCSPAPACTPTPSAICVRPAAKARRAIAMATSTKRWRRCSARGQGSWRRSAPAPT